MIMMNVEYMTTTAMIEPRPSPSREKKIGAKTSDGAVSRALTYTPRAASTLR